MSKSKRMAVSRTKLSQDAIFFLSKLFPWVLPDTKERLLIVDLKGKTLTPRAMEASCECIEAGYLYVDEEQFYRRLKLFPTPTLKLQRVREAYEAFDIFAPDTKTKPKPYKADWGSLACPLINAVTDLSRIQTDLLQALRYTDLSDPVACLHVRHAIEAIRRLSTDGVKGLETVLESGN